MKSQSTLKTLIIGLDGATFDIILPLIRQNKLPTMAFLLQNGAWGPLESTIPPITAAAWTSFMTGENPGKHGIIDFIKRSSSGVEGENQQVVTTADFSGRTFFDVMAREGLRVGAITVPVTYPPWDINGIMISGYPCPDNDKIYSTAKEISFDLEEPLNFSAEYYKISSEEKIIEDCIRRDKLRADLMFDLLERYEFDCFAMVLGGTDRAQHDYWKYHDPDYPKVEAEKRNRFKDAIARNYILADEVLAGVLDRFGDRINLFILSDHGAGRHPFKYFNINLWLKKNGMLQIENGRAYFRETAKKIAFALHALLTPKDQKRSRLTPKFKPVSPAVGGGSGKVFIWPKTKAFYYPLMYPTGGIMINLKGRQPNGMVLPGEEYEAIRDTLIRNLLAVRDHKTGERVIAKACRREDVYQGPHVDDFPDIIYVLNQGYESGRNLFGPEISPVQDMILAKKSGLHLMDGIFIAYGPQIKSGQMKGARIIDVAPTVLFSTGFAIPDNMDGEVLQHIFKEELLNKNPVRCCDWKEAGTRSGVSVESLENEQMKDKLRSLGYI